MITPTGNKGIDKALTHIATNYADDLTVETLAKVAGYSKFHFSRLFTRLVGRSPGRHITHVRMEQAKILLTTTDMLVVEVGNKVGRVSLGTFSSAFRHAVGCAPREFRIRSRRAIAEATTELLGAAAGRIRP